MWLRHYGSVDHDRFAVVKVSGDLLHDPQSTERIASSLAFLHRVGLYPVVVHGAGLFTGLRGSEVRAAMEPIVAAEERGEDPSEEDLLAAAGVARQYMVSANQSLVSALERLGVGTVALPESGFQVERLEEGYGPLRAIQGRVLGADLDAIREATEEGLLPILGCLGRAEDSSGLGDVVTFSTAEATSVLARDMCPLKVIYLRQEGALHNIDDERVVRITLAEEFESLVDHHALELRPLKRADANLLREINALFETGALQPGSTAAVTDPSHLADELFSLRGGGTLIVPGEKVRSYSSLDDVDLEEVKSVLEASFQAELPDTFFPSIRPLLRRIIVSETGRGVAIVTERAGLAYLDKFAVHPSAQGELLGEAVWRSLVRSEPKLFWRSRTNNAVNGWYFQQSTGAYKRIRPPPEMSWTVFWKNLSDEEINKAIPAALAISPTFNASQIPPPSPQPATLILAPGQAK